MFTLFQRLSFCLILCGLVCACHNQTPTQSRLMRIGVSSDPTTIDPRKMRDLTDSNYAHLLYEGLTRTDNKGIPQLAIADAYTISPDLKTYTFSLRDSKWSNGDPVTAKDFERSWKESINPQNPSPNAYQFFVIKGAKEANQNNLPLDQVGIHAINDSTLVVELSEPTPYFLKLTAAYFSVPIHPSGSGIVNGPFKLKEWKPLNQVLVEKNPHYWDRDKVKLDGVAFVVADDNTAVHMYEKNELDWVGSPLGTLPSDAISTLKTKPDFHSSPAAATYFVNFNTTLPPFDNQKIRQAFRDTLRREELTEHVLQGNQSPAYTLVPHSFPQPLFSEKELSLATGTSVTLSYAANDRNHKIAQALQQQWRQHLGIEVQLQSYESKLFLQKRKDRDFQLALGSWFADFSDPVAFLEIFKEKNNGTNSTGWEKATFQQLLNQAEIEQNADKRLVLLKEAEKILIEESPIITLYHNTYNYLEKPWVSGIYFSDLGYVDFKNADIEKP